jgi:hypothetical protein
VQSSISEFQLFSLIVVNVFVFWKRSTCSRTTLNHKFLMHRPWQRTTQHTLQWNILSNDLIFNRRLSFINFDLTDWHFRCGSPNKNTTSLVPLLSTENASKEEAKDPLTLTACSPGWYARAALLAK